VVLDPAVTPLMRFRNGMTPSETLDELCDRAFSLIIMGDDRAVHATYIMGELAFCNSTA